MTHYRDVLKAVREHPKENIIIIVSDDTDMLLIHGCLFMCSITKTYSNDDRTLMIFNDLDVYPKVDITITKHLDLVVSEPNVSVVYLRGVVND